MVPYEEKCFIPVDSCSCSSWSLSKCLADSSRHWRGRLLLASSGYNSFLDLSGQTVCTQMENGSAVLIAHAVGFCSLLVTLWQFLLETDETRNMTLAVFSQMFSVSTPLYLFGGIARTVWKPAELCRQSIDGCPTSDSSYLHDDCFLHWNLFGKEKKSWIRYNDKKFTRPKIMIDGEGGTPAGAVDGRDDWWPKSALIWGRFQQGTARPAAFAIHTFCDTVWIRRKRGAPNSR